MEAQGIGNYEPALEHFSQRIWFSYYLFLVLQPGLQTSPCSFACS